MKLRHVQIFSNISNDLYINVYSYNF